VFPEADAIFSGVSATCIVAEVEVGGFVDLRRGEVWMHRRPFLISGGERGERRKDDSGSIRGCSRRQWQCIMQLLLRNAEEE